MCVEELSLRVSAALRHIKTNIRFHFSRQISYFTHSTNKYPQLDSSLSGKKHLYGTQRAVIYTARHDLKTTTASTHRRIATARLLADEGMSVSPNGFCLFVSAPGLIGEDLGMINLFPHMARTLFSSSPAALN